MQVDSSESMKENYSGIWLRSDNLGKKVLAVITKNSKKFQMNLKIQNYKYITTTNSSLRVQTGADLGFS